MRVLLSGGGTAGHINPALAIADKIKSEIPDAQIAFVGTPRGMENILVEKAGYEIFHVDVKGFQRKLTPKNIAVLWKAITSPIKAASIIKKFDPDIVIGTGGYVSWPVVKAAAKRKIPTAIHEQNAFSGVTTRMLSSFVDRVMISFEETRCQLKTKDEHIVLTGNPVRRELFEKNREEERRKLGITSGKYLLSYGGSLGARAINDACLEMFKNNSFKDKNVFHTHAVGAYEWKKRAEEIKNLGETKNGEALEYIYDMPSRMCASDLVVCRAGAITLAELAVLGKPAILIPSPYVTDDHQLKNAMVYERAGAAVIIEEKDLTFKKLKETVEELISDEDRLAEMSRAARSLAVRDTDERIFRIIKELTEK